MFMKFWRFRDSVWTFLRTILILGQFWTKFHLTEWQIVNMVKFDLLIIIFLKVYYFKLNVRFGLKFYATQKKITEIHENISNPLLFATWRFSWLKQSSFEQSQTFLSDIGSQKLEKKTGLVSPLYWRLKITIMTVIPMTMMAFRMITHILSTILQHSIIPSLHYVLDLFWIITHW